MTGEKMIERFQCPGCVGGMNTKCGGFEPEKAEGYVRCKAHVLGTYIMPMPGHVALGLPKGFNRPGCNIERTDTLSKMLIRCWTKGSVPEWDVFNVPVWALERDGFLFVRTYMPRTNRTAVDIIEGGTLALCPQAINVGKFWEEID